MKVPDTTLLGLHIGFRLLERIIDTLAETIQAFYDLRPSLSSNASDIYVVFGCCLEM
jgi:hypothetical protein